MGPGSPTRTSTSGVTEIQKNLASRTRLIVAVVATAFAAAIASVVTSADFSFPVATSLAWLAVAGLVLGLLQGRGVLLPAGIVAVGLVALAEIMRGVLAVPAAPIIGAALLASAEFGYWSFELQVNVRPTASGIIRRVGVTLGVVVVGAAVSGTAATLVDVFGRGA